eukprot:1138770-Pleurochrysis_carterae.AAC.3
MQCLCCAYVFVGFTLAGWAAIAMKVVVGVGVGIGVSSASVAVLKLASLLSSGAYKPVPAESPAVDSIEMGTLQQLTNFVAHLEREIR